MKPFFSIITCTYNAQEFLVENINSVKSQSFTNFEQIFIDGFSKDKTLEIIKAYKKSNKNVRLFNHPPKGISNAMNEGIKKANGQYIIHLHADDLFAYKNVLSNVSRKIRENQNPDVLVGKIIEIDKKGVGSAQFPKKIFFKMPKIFLNFYNFIPHQAVFIRRNIFKKYGMFDEKLRYCMDYDLWLRLNNNTKLGFINEEISKYRVHEGACSSSNNAIENVHLEYKKVQYSHSPRIIHSLISWVDSLIWIYATRKDRSKN